MATSIFLAWRRLVRADPKAPAMIDAADGKVWSRRELDELGGSWPGGTTPPRAGRLVAFPEPNGAAWLKVLLGSLRTGAVAVPIDSGGPDGLSLAIAEKLRASYLWNMDQLIEIGSRSRVYRDGRRIVKLTSGSSGEPRALPFTDTQMLADGRQICAAMEIRSNDVNLALIPFGHSYGLGNLVMPLLARGVAMVCASSPLPQVLAATVERWRPTVFPAVPAVLRALVAAEVAPAPIRRLRTVISAGSPLAPDLARAFWTRFGLKIHNFYGSSETGGIAYDRTGNAALAGQGVGRPLPGVRLTFGRGRRLAVSSPAVFTIGNRRRSRGNGVHRPADTAEVGRDGVLRLLGRIGREIKVGARRVNPVEIERAFRALAGVRDARVIRHPDRSAALAAALAGTCTAESVRSSLVGRLESWKIPRKLLIMPEFPLTPRGKTDARRLRELLAAARPVRREN